MSTIDEKSPRPPMSRTLADRILVWAYSDTVAYTIERCDWYSADSPHLHFAVSEFIKDQLSGFYAEFSEWFNLAEYPDIVEQFAPSEVALFVKAAGAPGDTDFSTMDDYNSFSGLRAVIRHRLEKRSLEDIRRAAELFNWTIDFGLCCSDANAQAFLRVGPVAEVAPFLLQRILNQLPTDGTRHASCQVWPSAVARFLPLEPVVAMLKETMESADWAQNQLALRIFFWIAGMYKADLLKDAA